MYSIKNPYYYVYVVVDEATNTHVPTPVSGCTCPASIEFCLYQLGMVGIFYILKHYAEMKFAQASQCLPEPVQCIQSLPIPLEFFFRKGKHQWN